MARKFGLLHVNLNVHEIPRSVRFYTDALGFVLVSDAVEMVDLGAGPELLRQAILTIPHSRTILALTHVRSFLVGATGLNHLGLIVESDEEVASIVERVPHSGGIVQKQGHREGMGFSEAFAYVRDPDGYAIELATQNIVYAQIAELNTAGLNKE